MIYSARTGITSASAQPDAKGDRIYNGAVDNGTGIASLLELAASFARAPSRTRSVRGPHS